MTGAYVSSFGSVRSLTATNRILGRGGFAVLEAPAPAPDTAGRTVLDVRRKLSLEALTKVPVCRTSACRSARQRALQTYLSGSQNVPADTALFSALSIAANAATNEDVLGTIWAGDLPRATRTALKQAAASYALRGAKGAATPALVGYLGQLCSAYEAWPTAGDALDRMHRPCQRVAAEAAYMGAWQDFIDSQSGQVILVANPTDPVSSGAWQERWNRGAAADKVYTFRQLAHTSMPSAISKRIRRDIASR